MRASLTALVVVLLGTFALSISGCGLKDDLYLPDDPADAATAPATTQDDDARNGEKKPAGAGG